MIIHKMNRVSGFIIIITGALVRLSEYHIILDILIKSRYTAVQTAVRNYPRYPTLVTAIHFASEHMCCSQRHGSVCGVR